MHIYCSGYNINEDENPADHQAFYQYLEEGIWNLLQKIPRGYMVPIPRVGRRHLLEEKRQNMIPQPRIGRQLDADELTEILIGIQNFLQNIERHLPSDSLSARNNFPNTKLSSLYSNMNSDYLKHHPEDSLIDKTAENSVYSKDSTARKDSGEISLVNDNDYSQN